MRSGSGDDALVVARCTVQHRDHSLATARAHPSSDRCAAHFVRGICRHSKGYFATSAPRTISTLNPQLSTHNPQRPPAIVNRKSNNRKFYPLPSTIYPLKLDSVKCCLHCVAQSDILRAVFDPSMFGRGAVVAQLTVNQLVAGSNPAARAIIRGFEINGKCRR